MKRKLRSASSATNSSGKGLNLPLSIVTFFLGVIATFAITQVFAQTADTNQIYACVNNTNGGVRIITSNENCKTAERSVKWSIQGPPGPQGPAGSTGGLNQYFGLPFICNQCALTHLADRFVSKDFSYAQITRSDFTGGDINRVIFKNAYIQADVFTNANLTGADLSNINDANGRIPSNNIFTGANVTSANFSNSLLHEWNLTNVNLQNANFSNAVLRRTKFTGAQNGSTANFTGATFEGVTCPDGTNSDNNGNSCEGHF